MVSYKKKTVSKSKKSHNAISKTVDDSKKKKESKSNEIKKKEPKIHDSKIKVNKKKKTNDLKKFIITVKTSLSKKSVKISPGKNSIKAVKISPTKSSKRLASKKGNTKSIDIRKGKISSTTKGKAKINVKGKNKKTVPKREIIKLSHRYKNSWEGNSDSDGSVDSAVMDEDICFYCGNDTADLPEDQWGNLVICDVCDGEYHLLCVKLDRVPRNSFTCTRCKKDSIEFEKLKYTVDLPQFELKKKKSPQISYCYSPSRPLESAWEECKRKGMMIVSNVFSHEIMKLLTHGIIDKTTKAGRISDVWSGAAIEVAKRLSDHGRNVIDRDGRFDIRLPEFVIQQLQLETILKPITDKLRSIMGHPEPRIRTHNVVFVPVGSTPQKWHADDTTHKCKTQRYFTILIHLNPIDQECGGTEIWDTRVRRNDVIRGRPGDAFVFNGSVMHRGLGNWGNSHRFFYYASFSCKDDANTDRDI